MEREIWEERMGRKKTRRGGHKGPATHPAIQEVMEKEVKKI